MTFLPKFCILFILGLFLNVLLVAQSFIGISAGPNVCKLFDITRDEYYKSTYQYKPGVSVMGYYESVVDSHKYRIELQYQLTNANLDVSYVGGNASFYTHADFQLQYIGINLNFREPLNKNSRVLVHICFGPTLDFLIKSQSEGLESQYHYHSVDSNNNPVNPYLTWETLPINNHSKTVSNYAAGLSLGYDIQFPLGDRLDFVFKNDSKVALHKIILLENLGFTSLLTFNFGFGVRYRLSQ